MDTEVRQSGPDVAPGCEACLAHGGPAPAAQEPLRRLYVLLVHGTWTKGAWTHAGSEFRARLASKLSTAGYDARIEAFPWSGGNSAQARESSDIFLAEHFRKHEEDDRSDRPCLVIAHSHGGNVVVSAMRRRVLEFPDTRFRLGVCMATPFLTKAPRGLSNHWRVWVWLAFLTVVATLLSLFIDFKWTGPAQFWKMPLSLVDRVNYDFALGLVDPRKARLAGWSEVGWSVVTLASPAVLFYGIHRYIGKRQPDANQQAPEQFTPLPEHPTLPPPRVLCLASTQDEAISLLNVSEAAADAANHLLHPWAMVLTALVIPLVIYALQADGWCVWDQSCRVFSVVTFARWLGWCMLGFLFIGSVGAAGLSLVQGEPWYQGYRLLHTRYLVTIKPLILDNAAFRPIHETAGPRGNNWLQRTLIRLLAWLQLTHSQIYDTGQAVDEIVEWVQREAGGLLLPPAVPARVHALCPVRQRISGDGATRG